MQGTLSEPYLPCPATRKIRSMSGDQQSEWPYSEWLSSSCHTLSILIGGTLLRWSVLSLFRKAMLATGSAFAADTLMRFR